MKLYHGTKCNFTIPKLEKCRKHKDFGQGFYLTDNKEMAKNWAQKQIGDGEGCVNTYEIDDAILDGSDLKIKRFKADKKWVEFVYKNREIESYTHQYDIVIGPIADKNLQKHFAKIQRKENTFKEIVKAINYNRFKGRQYCFCTEKAIKKLQYDGN